MFNFFKKKTQEEALHYDPLDIRVVHLEKNYLLDYDLETWQVTKMAEYDWGNSFFSREFTIVSGDKKRLLYLEDDDELLITVSETIKFRKLGKEVLDFIDEKGKPPREITYLGITYYLDATSNGYYKDVEAENWEELVAYDYLDEDEIHCLSIEQWDDNEFEASCGNIIKEKEITNILPIKNEA